MKKFILSVLVVSGLLSGCFRNDADAASANLSRDADSFKIHRRIIFYNSFDSSYMMAIEGKCSLGNADKTNRISVTCKVGITNIKHFLGLSDNVTYMVEQLDSANVSVNHYKIVFKPSTILPDVEVR